MDVLDRFWSKTDLVGPCWVWKANKRNGYGRFSLNDSMVSAHRFSYELYKGEIPKDKELDHLCRNRACVNPTHLEPVTRKENVLRGVAPSSLNSKKTHCMKGHELTPDNLCKREGSYRECRTCKNISNSMYRKQLD